ncbi:hypothetical protein OROGR_008094 [Orobanche gracilis]
MEDCELLDMGAFGSKFTWFRRGSVAGSVSKRLDQCLGDVRWRLLFPEAVVENLPRVHSDHCPMLLRCWEKKQGAVLVSLDEVRKEATEFNRSVFGNIFHRKRVCENRMKATTGIWPNLISRRGLMVSKIKGTMGPFWRSEYSFFHSQTIVRRKRNKVHGLFLQDGSWSTDQARLSMEAKLFFQHLFALPRHAEPDSFQITNVPRLCSEGVNALLAPVSKEEVRSAVFSMKSFKAPGPDGIQPYFFKKYWYLVGDAVWKTVAYAFASGKSDQSLLETLIVLIPKVDHPTQFKEFRHISLCTVLYKVLTKVIVGRIC